MDPIRVVLADDHRLFREGTRELLERDGAIVVVGEAADGNEVVDLVDRLSPDVAIIDIEMPGSDGVEATRRIKRNHPGVGVLVLTVHDEDPLVFAILDAGAAGYLLKDVGSADLVRTVRALHAGESVLHPVIVEKVLRRVRSGESGTTREVIEELPARDLEVLRLAARGSTNQEIASALDVSVRTVQLRLSDAFKRLHAGSRTEAVIAALRAGHLELEELEP